MQNQNPSRGVTFGKKSRRTSFSDLPGVGGLCAVEQCDCFDYVKATCFIPVAAGDIADGAGNDACGACCFQTVCCAIPVVGWCMADITHSCVNTSALRAKHNLEEQHCNDCLKSVFCAPCAKAQELRFIKEVRRLELQEALSKASGPSRQTMEAAPASGEFPNAVHVHVHVPGRKSFVVPCREVGWDRHRALLAADQKIPRKMQVAALPLLHRRPSVSAPPLPHRRPRYSSCRFPGRGPAVRPVLVQTSAPSPYPRVPERRRSSPYHTSRTVQPSYMAPERSAPPRGEIQEGFAVQWTGAPKTKQAEMMSYINHYA